jgi:hypothetical protein
MVYTTDPAVYACTCIPLVCYIDVCMLYVLYVYTVYEQDPPALSISSVHSLQLMLSKFEYDKTLNPKWRPGSFKYVLHTEQ